MKGLILTMKQQTRLQVMNGVRERWWKEKEAAELLGVSKLNRWRLLVSYRRKDATTLAQRNRNRPLPNSTSPEVRAQIRYTYCD